jgi:molecular chaperone GrpE
MENPENITSEETQASMESENDANTQLDQENSVEKLESELAEAKDKFIRLYSEFENYRRRTAKERLELIETSTQGLMVALLPVLDDFDRAGKSFENATEVSSLKDGLTLVSQKFARTLEQKGLKKMEVAKGDEFTTELHEAITQIPVDDEGLKGKVVDVVENGYYLGEKVIRFAKVVIGA